MNNCITFEHAVAKIYCFDNGTEVTEYQVVISLTNPLLTYKQQLETLLDAFAQVKKDAMAGASVVFKRFFLSDASNQADELVNYEMEAPEGAMSIIQQALPDREIVGIDCCAVIKQHGSLHCCTMQYY
jgi:agmatine/peptidylarginine deiminase